MSECSGKTLAQAGKQQTECGGGGGKEREDKRVIQEYTLWRVHVPSCLSQQGQFRIDLGDGKFERILCLFLLAISTLYFDDWSFGTGLENA